MTNLDSLLKSRDISSLTKVHIVKALTFPVLMYRWESWTIKKAESWRIDAIELEKTLESSLDSKEIKSVNSKENQPWIFTERTVAEAEAPKLWTTDVKSQFTGKDPDAGKGVTGWDSWMASPTQWTSVQFSCLVISNSLWPHQLQHARLPCPSSTPGACSNSCLSWSCLPTISSSVIPFSSCLQTFPESGFFQWVHSLYQVAEVLEFQLQHLSLQWIFRIDFL